ncbi:unnamed protein product [Nippostrongylus brasiliensis]|uniref:RPAP1_N domain-containing protein n=1 Tax=Nippostrongylus brasiliensis TaxID=27835 RepID=A0A0N4YTB1_NIPBR|nr:unnamed protein product [Nippostrongylus brasiliensis]
MYVKRPSSKETEDDLLAMQAEWEANQARKKQAGVQIHRMKKRSGKPQPRVPPSKAFEEGGRFVIDLEKITEEWSNRVLFDVEERNPDWLESDHSDDIARLNLEKLQFSADDGFPEVLDLGAYYRKDVTEKRNAGGKSFFAAEFDRLQGRLDDVIAPGEPEVSEETNFEVENDKYLAGLGEEKINELKNEIMEKIDKNTIEFLKNRRHKRKIDSPSGPKVSKFKASRAAAPTQLSTRALSTQEANVVVETPLPPQPPVVQDMLDQLEVLDEFPNRSDEEKYNRLATDAYQLDFTTNSSDALLALARSRIDEIKELYLEEVKSGEQTIFQFAHGVNPLVDGSWTLIPVRRVLDAVHKREGEVIEDDIEIVRLALLWTVLLHDERSTVFLAFAEPSSVYVRLAEVLLIGPEVLADDTIALCYSRILTGYVQKVAIEGRLCMRMDSRIANLDAFMPFFEDLLIHYEQYSLGDVNFARTLLIGSYLNSAISDSIEFRSALWSPKRNTARQMIIKLDDAEQILTEFRRLLKEHSREMEEKYYVQYTSLLGAYTAAIRDKKVLKR